MRRPGAGGRGELATRLRDAVAGAATGTELVMAVRWHLRAALKVEPRGSAFIPTMRTLVRELGRLLR
ncbi:MAG: hypothetical protein WBO45_14780 [Planctomycetota bacterium]